MSRGQICAATILVCMAAIGLSLVIFGAREPRYGGKSLSYWAVAYGEGTDSRAADAIRRMGPAAVPFLAQKAAAPGGGWKSWLAKVGGDLPVFGGLIALPRNREILGRYYAAMAFRVIGTNGAPAVPVFNRLFLAGELEGTIGLAAIGKPAVSALEEILTNTTYAPRQRAVAAKVCAQIGTNAMSTEQTLLRCLSDPSTSVVECAAAALPCIGSSPERSVSALTNLLAHASMNVQSAAVEALGGFGAAAVAAVPYLASRTNDSNAAVRLEAGDALAKIDTVRFHGLELSAEQKRELRFGYVREPAQPGR